jgi:hypothetical protein
LLFERGANGRTDRPELANIDASARVLTFLQVSRAGTIRSACHADACHVIAVATSPCRASTRAVVARGPPQAQAASSASSSTAAASAVVSR